MNYFALLLTLLPAFPVAGASFSEELAGLRSALAQQPAGGEIGSERLSELARHALALADRADEQGELFSALTLVAELTQRMDAAATAALRTAALERLGTRFYDSLRWSIQLSESFIPPLERISREHWEREFAAYDRVLETLQTQANDPRLRAELLYARLSLRLWIDRRWDWLSEEQRRRAVGWAGELESCCASLPVPGTVAGDTVGARARRLREELEQLGFGAIAPPTAGVDLEGRPLDLAGLRGKVVVLDFWTTFCLPCLAMVPGTRALLERLGDRPVVFVGVNGDNRREQALGTAQRSGMTWPSFWDGPSGTEGPLTTTWRVSAWPTLVVLDTHGRIRYKFLGQEAAEAGLEPALEALLAEIGTDTQTR